eukprot:2416349-Amphidinium_carterae.1
MITNIPSKWLSPPPSLRKQSRDPSAGFGDPVGEALVLSVTCYVESFGLRGLGWCGKVIRVIKAQFCNEALLEGVEFIGALLRISIFS